MRLLSKIFVIAALVAGCGGGDEDARPGPLNKRYDDMHIARVPMDQRATETTARNDWSVAKAENAKAEGDYNAISSQLTIVRNDREKAKLQVSSGSPESRRRETPAPA